MEPPIHIIYLPGFFITNDKLRLTALKWWKYRHVTVEFLPMKWESKETFEQKVARIDQAIDRAKGKRIVIMGESAGGSMAVCMYVRRYDDLYKVVTICGKNNHPETVGEKYYKPHPVYRAVMDQLEEALEQLPGKRMEALVSVHPLYDPVVPVHDTLLPDCKRVRLWAVGHVFVISLALTILSPFVIRAIKKRR